GLSCVAPPHWEEGFGLPPEALIAAAVAGGEHASDVLDSWAEAARLTRNTGWVLALWTWACTPRPKARTKALETLAAALRNKLSNDLPASTAQEYALRLLTSGDSPQDVQWGALRQALPDPWGVDFAQTYLRGLRAFVGGRLSSKTYDTGPWYESLPLAALALPPQCFAAAAAPWEVPDGNEWRLQEWRNRLNQFTQLLGLRRRMIDE